MSGERDTKTANKVLDLMEALRKSIMAHQPVRVGVEVRCATCGQVKQPVGRSAALADYGCNDDCPGYREEPRPGSLWPGERSDEFGYPVGEDGSAPLASQETDRG